MTQAKILWADDEIEHLNAHIRFLNSKEYEVVTVTNGNDALDELETQDDIDIVFLDENMPGLTGLETLEEVKRLYPSLPVIMITKSEEEYIMEDAIGSKISDYLIKPVNPNQILLSLRKNLDSGKLVNQKVFNSYTQKFGQLSMELSSAGELEDYFEVYKKLSYWDLELGQIRDSGLREMLDAQFLEANNAFGKHVKRNYEDWIHDVESPDMSQNLLGRQLMPALKSGTKVLNIVIDNLRYDQFQIIKSSLEQWGRIQEDKLYCAILPTATQYARNALFAGLMPADIKKIHPDLWIDENDEGSKNANEEALLQANLKRHGLNIPHKYYKVSNLDFGKRLSENFEANKEYQLITLVYNFVDMLSHARTDMEVIKELASDEDAYRSITKSWFDRSPLFEIYKKALSMGYKVFLTTDHGTVRTKNPQQVQGDRETSTNLRYKLGKNLKYSAKHVYDVRNPEDIKLPKSNISSSFIFALGHDFFVYPNNRNHYIKQYENTFQHGGVSLEEMLIPYAWIDAK